MIFKDLKSVIFLVKDYKKYIFGILTISVLYAFFEGLNIAILFPIIDSVIEAGVTPGAQSGIIRLLNKIIGFMPVKDVFISACIFIIVVVVFKNICRYAYMVLSNYASYRIWEDMQGKLFEKYINADYRFFLDRKHGEIVYRLYNTPASTGGALKLIPQFFVEILKIVSIGVVLFSMSLPVTIGVALISGLFYFFTKGISKKISYSLGKGRMEADQQEHVLINEMINGIKQIKVFLGERRWIASFFKAMNKYFRLARKDTLWISMPVSALEIFAFVSLSIFLIILRKFSPGSLMSNLPLLGVFAYAFQRIMPSLSLITTYRMQIMSSLPVLEVLHSALEEKVSCMEDGPIVMDFFNKGIEFRDVSFSYPGREEAVKNISVSFEKNRCTAIVGSSGSGKTTVVNLLIRLFDPTKGGIFVDGVDLREYKSDSWLRNIGFVSQDTFIFHASVRENIAFGLEGVKEEEIIKSAMAANAHDFVLKLPDGYDTIVGEKGMKLSGGERQRIAIARAILRNPPILIFDEATSALDNVSQSLIQDSISRIVKDHTVILIAHRLSTIVNADKIVVLDNGRVKEEGNHFELINKRGCYSKLYKKEDEHIPVA